MGNITACATSYARAHIHTSAVDSGTDHTIRIEEDNVQLVNILFTQSNYSQTALVACRVLRVNHTECTVCVYCVYISNVLFILRP